MALAHPLGFLALKLYRTVKALAFLRKSGTWSFAYHMYVVMGRALKTRARAGPGLSMSGSGLGLGPSLEAGLRARLGPFIN